MRKGISPSTISNMMLNNTPAGPFSSLDRNGILMAKNVALPSLSSPKRWFLRRTGASGSVLTPRSCNALCRV